MSRRYALPRKDGEVVILALEMAIETMNEVERKSGVTAYEKWLIRRMEDLLTALKNYNWEGKK